MLNANDLVTRPRLRNIRSPRLEESQFGQHEIGVPHRVVEDCAKRYDVRNAIEGFSDRNRVWHAVNNIGAADDHRLDIPRTPLGKFFFPCFKRRTRGRCRDIGKCRARVWGHAPTGSDRPHQQVQGVDRTKDETAIGMCTGRAATESNCGLVIGRRTAREVTGRLFNSFCRDICSRCNLSKRVARKAAWQGSVVRRNVVRAYKLLINDHTRDAECQVALGTGSRSEPEVGRRRGKRHAGFGMDQVTTVALRPELAVLDTELCWRPPGAEPVGTERKDSVGVCNIECRELVLAEDRLYRAVQYTLFDRIECHVLAAVLRGKVGSDAAQGPPQWVCDHCEGAVRIRQRFLEPSFRLLP